MTIHISIINKAVPNLFSGSDAVHILSQMACSWLFEP